MCGTKRNPEQKALVMNAKKARPVPKPGVRNKLESVCLQGRCRKYRRRDKTINVFVGITVVILAFGTVAALFLSSQNAKDFWFVTSPLIATAIARILSK
jgi:hypothetical protein